ncbi:unnamed protein product [Boreogadus saida]
MNAGFSSKDVLVELHPFKKGPGGGEDEDHSDEEDNGRQRKKGEVREGGAPEYSPSGARWLLSGNSRTEGKLEKGRQSGDTEAQGPGVTLEEDGHSLSKPLSIR